MEDFLIGFDYNDIEKKTDSEKLTLLLKIAKSNHDNLKTHTIVLFGNGKEGLVDLCRFHKRSLGGLWALVLFSIVGFAGILYALLREIKP
jgi:hypothetical protein